MEFLNYKNEVLNTVIIKIYLSPGMHVSSQKSPVINLQGRIFNIIQYIYCFFFFFNNILTRFCQKISIDFKLKIYFFLHLDSIEITKSHCLQIKTGGIEILEQRLTLCLRQIKIRNLWKFIQGQEVVIYYSPLFTHVLLNTLDTNNNQQLLLKNPMIFIYS